MLLDPKKSLGLKKRLGELEGGHTTALPLQAHFFLRVIGVCGWQEVHPPPHLGGGHGGLALVSGFLGSCGETAQPLWVHLSGRLFRPIDCCSQGAVLLEGPNVAAR